MDMNERSAFISYGEKKSMYTLWVIHKEVVTAKNGMQKTNMDTFYVKNLSTNKEAAIEKAVDYASKHGIEFVSTTNADVLLNEIERRNAEEIAQDKAKREEEAKQAEIRQEEERNRIIEENVIIFEDHFQSNKFTFGKYHSKEFSEVMEIDPQYIKYILSKNPDCPYQYPTNITLMCINSLYYYVQENGYPESPYDNSEYVGIVGDKLVTKVHVMGKTPIDGRFGLKYLYKFIDEGGNLIVTFYSGNTWSLDEGEDVTISGTIDKHQVYDNVKQTILKRVKLKDKT